MATYSIGDRVEIKAGESAGKSGVVCATRGMHAYVRADGDEGAACAAVVPFADLEPEGAAGAPTEEGTPDPVKNASIDSALREADAGKWDSVAFFPRVTTGAGFPAEFRLDGGYDCEDRVRAAAKSGKYNVAIFYKNGAKKKEVQINSADPVADAVVNAAYSKPLAKIMQKVKPLLDRRIKGDMAWEGPRRFAQSLREVCDTATMSAGRYDGKRHRVYDVSCSLDGQKFSGFLIVSGLLYYADPDDMRGFDEYDMTLSISPAGRE